MAVSKATRRPSHSTILAAALLLAAAGFAAYGLWPSSPSVMPGDQPSATLPGAADDDAAVRRLSTSGLPTRVVLERLGIDAPVSEVGVVTTGGRPLWETAWRSAGHHMDSALPGQPGNLVLSGHVSVADSSNLAVFSALEDAAAGDVVEVFSGDTVHRYLVERVAVVAPTAVQLLRSDHNASVTLITCTRDLKNRVVVVGKLV